MKVREESRKLVSRRVTFHSGNSLTDKDELQFEAEAYTLFEEERK
jgi:hypothetical protein